MTAFSRWFLSLRPFSFPASLMPVTLAAVMVAGRDSVDWWVLPLFLGAAVLFHAGTNVLNDYYDFKNGIDGPQDRDPTHTLPRGIVTPRFMLITGNLYFALGLTLGSAIAVWRGPVFFLFGLLGAAGAYFYTGARFSLKYRALGDLAVFLLMGPALVFLGVWALRGTVDWSSLLISLPQAFLVTAILHGNNLRDIKTDANAGVSTVAGLLGPQMSRHFLLFLFAGAFITQAILTAVGLLPWLSMLAFAALPPALVVARRAYTTTGDGTLLELPMWCAGIHLLHGLLYTLTLLVAR